MDQDTLKALLKEAKAEVVEGKLQALLELDRWAFLQEHGDRRAATTLVSWRPPLAKSSCGSPETEDYPQPPH